MVSLIKRVPLLLSHAKTLRVTSIQLRNSNIDSPFVEDLDEVNVKYEVTRAAEDWKYVEQALPPTIVPTPVLKEKYSSEWKPQGNDVQHLPYYIQRTKNHMIPVYLKLNRQGNKRTTVVRKVQGDIWLLEKGLREFLQPQQSGPIRSQVNEFAGLIRINGDHVNAIKYWLQQKNL